MGYLNGYYSGLTVKSGRDSETSNSNETNVGVLGGQDLPNVKRFVNGFGAGVKKSCSNCQVLCGFANGFENQNDQGAVAGKKFIESGVEVVSIRFIIVLDCHLTLILDC